MRLWERFRAPLPGAVTPSGLSQAQYSASVARTPARAMLWLPPPMSDPSGDIFVHRDCCRRRMQGVAVGKTGGGAAARRPERENGVEYGRGCGAVARGAGGG